MVGGELENEARIGIRVRRVVGPDGRESLDASVRCPLAEHVLAVDDCVECPHCRGFTIDRRHGGSNILCESARDEDPRDEPRGHITLARVMTRDVLCFRVDTPLGLVEEVLLTAGVSGAPVVDVAGRPLGIVSKTDLLQALHDGAGEARPVGEVCTPLVFSLPERAPLAQAAALMAWEGVHRIPVVGDDGAVVGIVSALDVARWLAEQDGLPP